MRQNLGKPDIQIAGLKFWIHGYQFSDFRYQEDANWVNVTINCSDQRAEVVASGPILQLPDISHLLKTCETLHAKLEGEAEINPLEPYFDLSLKAKELGHIEMKVFITPDNLKQRHEFIFDIDQSYLPKVISDCRNVLSKFPIRELNNE